MKFNRTLCLLVAFSFSQTQAAWGYGSSSSSKACDKPGFSGFTPGDKATVPAKSEFSFLATPNTRTETLKVTVKGEAVPVEIRPVAQGFEVTGKLPEQVKGTFARVDIQAQAASQCKGSGGWLLNIGH